MSVTFVGKIGDEALKGTERSACVKASPSAANVLAVVVEAEGVESVVNETCAPPAPENATEGIPSFAASHAAPLLTFE